VEVFTNSTRSAYSKDIKFLTDIQKVLRPLIKSNSLNVIKPSNIDEGVDMDSSGQVSDNDDILQSYDDVIHDVKRTTDVHEKSSDVEGEVMLRALTLYRLSDDFERAYEVFNSFTNHPHNKRIKTKAYILLISSFIHTKKTIQDKYRNMMELIVKYVIKSNIDMNDSTLSNLLLKYYSIRNDIMKASIYIHRMYKNKSIPDVQALQEYSKLICSNHDSKRALGLMLYMKKIGYVPFPELSMVVENR
jgi:hypothetical protein